MTGSWLALKARPQAAEDRVRCGDAPKLLWYVRENAGKASRPAREPMEAVCGSCVSLKRTNVVVMP